VPIADISQTKLLIQGHSKTGSQSAFEAVTLLTSAAAAWIDILLNVQKFLHIV
jgi:hypothetical protein